ncbi:hypothetical protein F4813DRAFT_391976 [Daldinia decipiens]|uniref:uncharacterized protein n=1 Tax=Daldinia decipiens TaxID=326647 RepID=UPI0020C3C700|nr:uncharacterized protein F4813DRAFT_391976 [Daldinia decipiens]KAI1655264.1 hypothetical protein F4813DRAFT_391976 [Daldinia decipiens]
MSHNPQGEEPPRDPPGEPSGTPRTPRPPRRPGRPGPRDSPAFRGIPTPRPGVDSPIFYFRGRTGPYDAAFYSAPGPSQQPANEEEAVATPLRHHYYGCPCVDCLRYYHPNNYFTHGSHDPTGVPGAHHPGPGGAAPQTNANDVHALDRAGIEALNRQAQDYVFQTATSHARNVRVPQMQYQPPQFQSGPAHGQVAVQGQYQGQHQGPSQGPPKGSHPKFNEKELKELKAYRERKEREEREERVRRFREQNERAIGFHESDDEEFIPNIRNP